MTTLIERQDLIAQKLNQAAGICGLIAEACGSNGAVNSSAWAAATLIREAKELTQQALVDTVARKDAAREQVSYDPNGNMIRIATCACGVKFYNVAAIVDHDCPLEHGGHA